MNVNCVKIEREEESWKLDLTRHEKYFPVLLEF